MKRRDFIKNLSLVSSGMLLMPRVYAINNGKGSGDARALKGFIVSDAHFGWENKKQPAVDKQLRMMHKIMARFPDLNMMIDTGDAHHNGKDRDDDRKQWTEAIPGISRKLPFYYVPGNHEITHCSAGDDEYICDQLGSITCRPYYSFDMHGIHFVSVPEMVRAVYVTRETIEWLIADLELNKDKTTVLLSHNNIKGTTGPFREGYRGLANSQEMEDIIKKYPNVISWMHGHNHNYEIVRKHNRLFVSNGRIGGFDPSHGEYGLGGIYFEITPEGLTVKCYSAEFEQFLEHKNPSLTQSISKPTTFKAKEPPSYTFGYGGARNGQKIPAYIHHTSGQQKAELFFAGTSTNVINDDPNFELFMARKSRRGEHWQLMGSAFNAKGKNEGYKWMNPGIKIFKSSPDVDQVVMQIPRSKHESFTYYRCAPGNTYRIYTEMDAGRGNQIVELYFIIHDRHGKELVRAHSENWQLAPGINRKKASYTVPEIRNTETIYTDPESDNVLHLSVEAKFNNIDAPVLLKTFELTGDTERNHTQNPGLTLNDHKYDYSGSLSGSELTRVEIPGLNQNRYSFTVHAEGSKKVTWLIRQKAMDWQVKNAPVADNKDHLEIGPLRNTFSGQNEIYISPFMQADEPYFNFLKDIHRARVFPINRGNDRLRLEILSSGGSPYMEAISSSKPKGVSGAKDWKYKDNVLVIQPGTNKVIEIEM